MRLRTIEAQFVDFIPEQLEPGVLYVSLPYSAVSHLCACGCGHEVATVLSPSDWRFTYDGRHISLAPSVGNWSLSCQSHYWIHENRVRWSGKWSQAQIDRARAHDRGMGAPSDEVESEPNTPSSPRTRRLPGWLSRWLNR